MVGGFVTDALVVIVVLGIMIFIHEAGHFMAAKSFGVRVLVFSLGFGKTLLHIKRGETDYRISALPFGGYVKMAGDDPSEVRQGEKGEFLSEPRWKRFVIVVMGPAMNSGCGGCRTWSRIAMTSRLMTCVSSCAMTPSSSAGESGCVDAAGGAHGGVLLGFAHGAGVRHGGLVMTPIFGLGRRRPARTAVRRWRAVRLLCGGDLLDAHGGEGDLVGAEQLHDEQHERDDDDDAGAGADGEQHAEEHHVNKPSRNMVSSIRSCRPESYGKLDRLLAMAGLWQKRVRAP